MPRATSPISSEILPRPPNRISTITATTIQCQIDMLPICQSLSIGQAPATDADRAVSRLSQMAPARAIDQTAAYENPVKLALILGFRLFRLEQIAVIVGVERVFVHRQGVAWGRHVE